MGNRYFLMVCIALISGCSTTTYQYVPPATEQGKFCIAQCTNARQSCFSDAESRAVRDRASCESRSYQTFTLCLIQANTKDEKKACEKRRPQCFEFANTAACEQTYRSCYAACGGKVTEVED